MTRWITGVLLLFFAAWAPAADVAAGQAPAGATSAAAARVIVLVRHGSYVGDPAIDPKLGPPLSPLGVAQAHLAGARLASLGLRFDVFRVSPMQRARDTAAVIAGDFPGSEFKIDEDLDRKSVV